MMNWQRSEVTFSARNHDVTHSLAPQQCDIASLARGSREASGSRVDVPCTAFARRSQRSSANEEHITGGTSQPGPPIPGLYILR